MDIGNEAPSGAAPESAVSDSAPAPVSAPAEASQPVEQTTARDSVNRAFEKAFGPEAAEAEKAPAPVETPKTERKRDETGKFAASEPTDAVSEAEAPVTEAKPATPLDEPPTRFSPDAKAAWKDAPEAIRGEVKRALTELETGLQTYQAEVAPLKPYIKMATEGGTTLDAALANYVGIEQTLNKDLVKGLDLICANKGLSIRDVAAHILGQPPEAQASQSDATIRELRAELNAIKAQVGTVTTTFEQQQAMQTQQEIQSFASSKPRFEELRPTIAQLLKGEIASNLQDAYDMAERLNPAPQQAAPVIAPVAKPDLTAQTRKGSLSVTGAPSSGSNPTNRKPASSSREALERAMSAL